jgi:hypothetical protein
LIHDALLLDTIIWLQIRNEQELHFISNVIRAHTNLKSIQIEFMKELNDCNMDELAKLIESSQIRHVSLKKELDSRINLFLIMQALHNAKTLTRIVVYFAPMPNEFEALAHALQNEQLKTLRLGLEELSPELWAAIIPVLSKHTSLRKLYLWTFGAAECQALGEFLPKNKSLEKLVWADSHCNEITAENVKQILIGLKNNTTVKKIYLIHPTALTEEAMNLLCESFSHNQLHISLLNIMCVKLSAANVRVLSESLKTNTILMSLEIDISSTDIDPSETIAICKSLEENNKLTSLSLNCTNDDCFAVADLLENNSSLKVLAVELYRVIDDGLWDLFDVISESKTLRELEVRMSLNNDAYEAIKNMLTINTTLKKLHVSRNSSIDSIYSLSEGLKNNSSLCHIVIGLFMGTYENDFYLNKVVLHEMLEVLETNFALDTIEFTCHGEQEFPKLLEPDLKRNRQLKSEARFKVVILSHNIARSHQALATLPRELWVSILSSVTHPGMEPFDDTLRRFSILIYSICNLKQRIINSAKPLNPCSVVF